MDTQTSDTGIRYAHTTGITHLDIAIAKLNLGLNDWSSVRSMIHSAQCDGTLPLWDSEGRGWTPEEIIEYGQMINPRR